MYTLFNKEYSMKYKQWLAVCVLAISSSVQAGWWEETKEATADMASSAWQTTKEVSSDAASSAWEATKETSSDLKDKAVESWDEVTSSSSDEESGKLSDITKLAEKETYVKAWEGIKESARNPDEPDVDAVGLPKE